MSSLDTQVGGDHYKQLAIQPVEFILKNKIPYMEGCAIKYLCRHRSKGGAKDLEKARHYIDILLELEYGVKPNSPIDTIAASGNLPTPKAD